MERESERWSYHWSRLRPWRHDHTKRYSQTRDQLESSLHMHSNMSRSLLPCLRTHTQSLQGICMRSTLNSPRRKSRTAKNMPASALDRVTSPNPCADEAFAKQLPKARYSGGSNAWAALPPHLRWWASASMRWKELRWQRRQCAAAQPSRVNSVIKLWRRDLSKRRKKHYLFLIKECLLRVDLNPSKKKFTRF